MGKIDDIIDIRKVKFNYSKKEKKIHLSEIFNAVKEYCDELEKFKGSNSISEQIIYVYAKPELTKKVIEEAYKNRHSINGRCKCAKTIYDAFNNLINNIIKIGYETNKCAVSVQYYQKRMQRNFELNDFTKRDKNEIIQDSIDEIKRCLNFLEEVNDEYKVTIINNISEVSEKLINFCNKLKTNSKIRLALADLKYLSSNILKKNLKKELEATKKTVSEMATAINNLIEQAESCNLDTGIKKKEPNYYFNVIKLTKEHYKLLYESIFHRMQKLEKKIIENGGPSIKRSQTYYDYYKVKNSFMEAFKKI